MSEKLITIKNLNKRYNIGTDREVVAVDKGALDCTIQARTVTAVHRAAEVENYDWKEIDSWNA